MKNVSYNKVIKNDQIIRECNILYFNIVLYTDILILIIDFVK